MCGVVGKAYSIVNYGGPTLDFHCKLPRACPIVASYGAGEACAQLLKPILSGAGIELNISLYPHTGHGFPQ